MVQSDLASQQIGPGYHTHADKRTQYRGKSWQTGTRHIALENRDRLDETLTKHNL